MGFKAQEGVRAVLPLQSCRAACRLPGDLSLGASRNISRISSCRFKEQKWDQACTEVITEKPPRDHPRFLRALAELLHINVQGNKTGLDRSSDPCRLRIRGTCIFSGEGHAVLLFMQPLLKWPCESFYKLKVSTKPVCFHGHGNNITAVFKALAMSVGGRRGEKSLPSLCPVDFGTWLIPNPGGC